MPGRIKKNTPRFSKNLAALPQTEKPETLWLFGLHAVRSALKNPNRIKKRVILTTNTQEKLADVLENEQIRSILEIHEPGYFSTILASESVHQGAAIEVVPLVWDSLAELCEPHKTTPLVVILDQVSDPHNVGAILRSAEVFGALAVIAPRWHSAPESGALAKAASGALERQPYLQVANLARSMQILREMGYVLIGLEGDGELPIEAACTHAANYPLGIVLGAEGSGIRRLTREHCDFIARISSARDFASLNVSNAAAVALFVAQSRSKQIT